MKLSNNMPYSRICMKTKHFELQLNRFELQHCVKIDPGLNHVVNKTRRFWREPVVAVHNSL